MSEINNERNDLLKYFKNELFELTEGCWVQGPIKQSKHNYINNQDYPIKIYKAYFELPLPDTLFYKINLSNDFILQQYRKQPSKNNIIEIKYYNGVEQFPILIYSYKFPINYENINLHSPLRPNNVLSNLDIINIQTYDKQIKDLEFKIFILKYMNPTLLNN